MWLRLKRELSTSIKFHLMLIFIYSVYQECIQLFLILLVLRFWTFVFQNIKIKTVQRKQKKKCFPRLALQAKLLRSRYVMSARNWLVVSNYRLLVVLRYRHRALLFCPTLYLFASGCHYAATKCTCVHTSHDTW